MDWWDGCVDGVLDDDAALMLTWFYRHGYDENYQGQGCRQEWCVHCFK